MENKKVEKYTRREETRQFNKSNILTETSGICHISHTNDSKELKNNTEDIHLNNSDNKILSKPVPVIEVVKDSNFDNEDEWDIDGIPELLSELDADIEKSLENIQTYKTDSKKNVIDIKQKEGINIKILNNIQETPKCSKSKTSLVQNFQNSLSLTSKNKSASTFAGFSKGGHLISTTSKSTFVCTTKLTGVSFQQLKPTKNIVNQDCTFSMSSQSGNNGNTSCNLSGAGINNVTSGTGNSCSNNSNKPNNKMSIDHQATLDKGLKMKIKRTKPGTKSSEAKHEIVKAIEQQQNGLTGGVSSNCSGNQEDIACVISVSNQIASNSQNSNMTLGINNPQVNINITNNKKNLGCSNNQSNTSLSNSGNISLGNTGSSNNNGSQTSIQGTKRGSSSHRRDKTKEKSSHSNRLGIEKNSSNSSEKESTEKVMCHCVGTDGNISNCSTCSCNRKTENNTLTQRLTTQNTSSNTSTVPPGVFTPSTESSNVGAAAALLTVTSAISTPISTQTISSSLNANAPGPPTKEGSANNGGNIKISSHIAAQLAAAAASTNSSNGSSITTSTFPNSDIKPTASNIQNQISKQLASGQISSTASHSLSLSSSNNKTVTPNVTDSISPNISSNEISESPPAKRIKHTDSNAASCSNSKEMIDMCIGTSVGTITEPECLGPCEPGTSVTLEGIVWHETEGGVLVVNVTWRGKTYVGTLLDCTRHDWAPPRFCDSPTEDLDARTPKGRGKRGRATITPDLSNFTETRSSIYFSHSHVHSKLRNGSNKGGRGTSRTTSVPPVEKTNSGSSLSSGNGGSTPSTSPTAFLPPRAEKRKSKDESPPPASRSNESSGSATLNASGIPITSSGGLSNQTQSFINPVTGLNVQINTKKCKTSSPCAISPVLLECPEQDCSKKYKHVNGLRYHQSHAHGSASLLDEDSMAETEEPVTPQPSPLSSTPTPSMTPNPSDIILNSQMTISSQLDNPESNTTKLDDENLPLQLENSEKGTTTETATSLPGEDILTESNNTKTATISSSSNISITSGTSHKEQQKQFIDIVGNKINNLRPQETNNQVTPHSPSEKSGVLRFGQAESNTALLSTNISNESLPQMESTENVSKDSDSPEKCVASQQELSNDTYCNEVVEKTACKGLSANATVSKSKKGRKTPNPADYDAVEVNTCNISSREEVQSPAYSDISDDSAPVNESDIIDKGNVSKNLDIVKKPQDVELSSSSSCPSNPSNITSTLGGYGVYQFYQQQQFTVPSSAEQQSSEKNTLSSNNTIISPSLNQQSMTDFNTKKDPSLDLMSKGNLNQHCQEINKDCSRQVCVTSSQGNSEISNIPSIGSSALTSTAPSKPVSHFYAFNYMPPNYPFNVDPNYVTSSVPTEDNTKHNRLAVMSSPSDQPQQHSSILFKDDRSKDDNNSPDVGKSSNTQMSAKPTTKSDSMVKSECIKQEPSLPQIPQHMLIQGKEHQGIGAYTNMYQRHPMTLTSQQLSREEELRRYYIFSDQQRRQNNSSQNAMNQQLQNSSQSGNQQCKDDQTSAQGQHVVQSQQQIKMKSNASLNMSKSGNSVVSSKESPKHKQEEDLKVIKQEGQKPTMETQGPPPPPTSQYFLHPSYITSTPFGFDPSHPMYRNVLMPTSSPYNTPPYHLPMPRYHAPEDLSRNTGTKALDALHHAASQYYTTHKIHELSERALKSPNNTNSNNASGTIKISGTSPNIGTSQHSNICSNVMNNHSVPNQPANVSQIQHNISSQGIAISNKQDTTGQKVHGNGTGVSGTSHNEPQKPQVSVNTTTTCTGNGNNNGANNVSNVSTSDSRSPPPQRHVHTHHHTHVGLGYPMYPAPYGAAVLASQQAAAVAVINPFPPGPNK